MAKMMSKALRAATAKAKETDLYWIEAAKLQFAVDLDRQRKAAGLSFKALAEKLGTSAAYMTKLFRGDTNATIESMVKLARATGGRLEVRIVAEADVADAHRLISTIAAKKKQQATPSSDVSMELAANDQRFALAA